jgi:hypothetical protein
MLHLTSGALFRNDGAGMTGEFSQISIEAQGFRVVRHCMKGDWTQGVETGRAVGP